MFLDEATILAKGGHGGRGCVSWRREKYISKGGPNGGDGGKGGDIYIQANANTDTLTNFASTKKFEAEKGRFGMGQNKNGKGGEDLILSVPPGTLIKEASTGDLLADLDEDGQMFLLCKGGRGGYGNAHFATSVRQRPDFAELGEPGEEKEVTLELKLVADVGIIGFPSVGKSTLISVISSAKPKIAEYHFTTLVPNLGVVTVDDRSFVVCDIPGLIEGASDGKGLGHTFLKHIERCGILVHLLDASKALGEGNTLEAKVLAEDYAIIRKELEQYSPTLGEKEELVVLNKIDLLSESLTEIQQKFSAEGITLHAGISAATHIEVSTLLKTLLPKVLEARTKRQQVEPDEELPTITAANTQERMGTYKVEERDDALYITGKRLEQFTIMTDFTSIGGVQRFKDVLDRIGLLKILKKHPETKIFIADKEIQDYL